MPDQPPRTKLRLFVAITLPEEVKTAIEQAQAELRRALPRPVFRWTKREQFHLTLKFLGYIEQSRVEELIAAIQRACQPFSSLNLRAGNLGFFPGGSRPRVLWVGIQDAADILTSLQQSIEVAVAPFTDEEAEDRFKGHVTLARIKDIQRSDAEKLRNAAKSLQDRSFGEWTARNAEVIQSSLSPTGARYTTVACAPFSHPV